MTSVADDASFSHPLQVRYLEVDQQGVVFNMWYLAYFDDAMTAYLAHRGVPYDELTAAGVDVQIVHTELDWQGSLGWGDDAWVDVSTAELGRTSFAIDFRIRVDDDVVASARTVYVVIATDGSGTRELPTPLRGALSPVAPLRS